MMIRDVRYEQAVYGSFPFWHRGYAMLAWSAGCQAEWLETLRVACQRFGERPAGTEEASSLFAIPLRRGPWMIVGVHPLGCDDQGRPGALAFHALFVGPRAYRKAGANPFVFAPALRQDWTESDQDTVLPPGCLTLSGRELLASGQSDERVEAIVLALRSGRRVVLQSGQPIEPLARTVWNSLPGRVRRWASVATWAFDNANRFDLVAVPRLAGVVIDPSDLVLAVKANDVPIDPVTDLQTMNPESSAQLGTCQKSKISPAH
jgi:hypothetical protein